LKSKDLRRLPFFLLDTLLDTLEGVKVRLENVEPLRIFDGGMSAYHEKHLKKRQLGQFVKAAEGGAAKPDA
jgi:hypothetical protein